jgi:acyl-CoA synthetase (NDP forming)
MDALTALQYLENPGERIALVGGGGAIGVFSCDLAFQAGLDLPRFSRQTQKCLKKHFPKPGNSMANPLDTGTPIVPVDTLKESIEEILRSEPLDILVMVLLIRSLEVEVPTFMKMIGVDSEPPGSYLRELLPVLARLKAQSGKDMVVVFENRAAGVADVDVERTGREMRAAFQSRGIPVFSSVPRALRGIRHAVAFKSQRQRAE